VSQKLLDGTELEVRCFGSRACTSWRAMRLLCPCGPSCATWCCAADERLIKAPSNDPFTALAIARTMIEMAPDHPLTKHVSVAYWKGGDTASRSACTSRRTSRRSWLGRLRLAQHVTRYIQPGLELISLDPKRSASIIGSETSRARTRWREAAVRLAAVALGAGGHGDHHLALEGRRCDQARRAPVLLSTDQKAMMGALNRFDFILDTSRRSTNVNPT
jgi:hypothetical protein